MLIANLFSVAQDAVENALILHPGEPSVSVADAAIEELPREQRLLLERVLLSRFMLRLVRQKRASSRASSQSDKQLVLPGFEALPTQIRTEKGRVSILQSTYPQLRKHLWWLYTSRYLEYPPVVELKKLMAMMKPRLVGHGMTTTVQTAFPELTGGSGDNDTRA